MAALANAKHERFAQELAKGTTQAEAYPLAGYKPDAGAASRLSGNVKIQARVAELLERAATRAEITVASITVRLLKIADDSEAGGDAANRSVARLALMDEAKLNGLVIDKSVRAETSLEDLLDSLDATAGSPSHATH